MSVTPTSAETSAVVRITHSEPKAFFCRGQDRFQNTYEINLKYPVGIFFVFPQVGEVWKIDSLGYQWILSRRLPDQNPVLGLSNQTGDVVYSTVSGRILFSDKEQVPFDFVQETRDVQEETVQIKEDVKETNENLDIVETDLRTKYPTIIQVDEKDDAIYQAAKDRAIAERDAAIEASQELVDNARIALEQAQSQLQTNLNTANNEISTLYTNLNELKNTDLPALESGLSGSVERLSEAEEKLSLAQAELEGLPTKISESREEAIRLASVNAEELARNARIAAEEAAKEYADAELSSTSSTLSQAISDAHNLAEAAKNAADGAIRTYYVPEPPTLEDTPELGLGDLWYDTDNDQASRWNGTGWQIIQDSTIAQALGKAEKAQSTADGKITTFYQTGKPFKGDIGDLWFDTDDNNKPYYCLSEDPVVWTPVRDGEITQAELRAAEDALEKAENARDEAIVAASTDASTKANAARDAAIVAAEAAAESARETAEANAAIEAARVAQEKADAAQTAAEQAAAEHADLVAGNAERDAIASAETRAKELADAARVAAEGAAKTHAEAQDELLEARAATEAARVAQERADAARQAAETEAGRLANAAQQAAEAKARTAQQAAEAAMAEAESKATVEYILSRGTDLVTNGTGYLNDNTNFTSFTFNGADAPTGTRGSFVTPDLQTWSGVFDELIPVDSSRRYMFRGFVRETNPVVTRSRFYFMISPFDGDGLAITPHYYTYWGPSMTTLTQDLKPGDTLVHVEDPQGMVDRFNSSSVARYVAAWNYKDQAGKVWGPGTYTRNATRISGLVVEGQAVRMDVGWAGPLAPAGTKVSMNNPGGSYMYPVSNQVATQEWVSWHGSTETGTHDASAGRVATTKFPHGTAAVRLGVLANRDAQPSPERSRHAFAGLSFSDSTQAIYEAERARAAADAAQKRADDAHTAAGSAQNAAVAAMDRANAVKGEASADATAKADAARQAAVNAASADATAKASAAQAAATQAAATDAQAKADAAAQAAQQAAQEYADQQASGASADALAAAKADATAKANAAQAAAEQAAALDAQAKANAAQAAAEQTAAADATAKSNAARAAAEAAAKTHADGLPKVLHGTTPPAGTAPNGSIWWQHQGTLSGAVIGQWNRVNGQWVSTPIRSEAIANLDLGKLTAGAAEIAEVVAQRVAAATGQFIELEVSNLRATKGTLNELVAREIASESGQFLSVDVGQLTATGTSLLNEVVARQIGAQSGRFVELEVGQLIAGEGVMDGAVINRLFSEVVVSKMAFADEFIGENAIITNSITSDKMNAQFFFGNTYTGATFQTTESHPKTMMDDSGVHVTDEDGQDLVYLGRQIGVRGADGGTLAQISDDGTISGQDANIVRDPSFLGLPLLGTFTDYSAPTRDSPPSWFDSLPWGLWAYGRQEGQSPWTISSAGGSMALIEVQADLIAGRAYRLNLAPFSFTMTSGKWADVRIGYEWNAQPTFSSSSPWYWQLSSTGTSTDQVKFAGGSFLYQPGSSTNVRFLVYLRTNGWLTMGNRGTTEFWIEDIGPIVEDTSIRRGENTSQGQVAPPPVVKKNYTKKYWARDARSYYTKGGYRTENTNYAYQGDQPGMGGMRSMILFPSMTGDLAGAEITGMTAHVDFSHWYYSGGGDAQIQMHNYSSLPTSMPSMEHGWTERGIKKPGSRTFNIPSRYWSQFKAGTLKGFGLGDTSPSRSEYGYGHWDRFWIEVKYRK